MTQPRIRAAFESTLGTWATSNSVSVAWENVASSPAAPFVRAHLLPADTTSEDLAGTHRHFKGIFQATLYLAQGTGPAAADALVASLDTAFPLTAPIVVSGLSVYITKPMSAGPAMNDAGLYVVPVSCAYVAHTI